MSGVYTASLEDLQAWARGIMQTRQPDFIIGESYLRRWWLVPRNDGCNVYLHEINKSDDDRALHDHPWDNISQLLLGAYIEHTPEGTFRREAGDIVHRKATAAHRLEVIPGEQAISLFITGPKVREWGFHCPKGWVPWREFVDERDTGQVGRGCGEHA